MRSGVWGCTPSTADTTSTAPSSTFRTRSTSAMKSGWPGVSMRLTARSPMAKEATADRGPSQQPIQGVDFGLFVVGGLEEHGSPVSWQSGECTRRATMPHPGGCVISLVRLVSHDPLSPGTCLTPEVLNERQNWLRR